MAAVSCAKKTRSKRSKVKVMQLSNVLLVGVRMQVDMTAQVYSFCIYIT